MARSVRFFLAFLPTVFLIVNTGCASLRNCNYSEAPSGQLFLTATSELESPQDFSKWADSPTERNKIRYLLERVAASKYLFIRNGEPHDGKVARQWLLYKMSHWVNGVDTANDFVTRVANGSLKTGKPYLVELPDRKIYTLESILRNELSVFESRLATIGLDKAKLSNSNKASLSPSTVPTVAVASSAG